MDGVAQHPTPVLPVRWRPWVLIAALLAGCATQPRPAPRPTGEPVPPGTATRSAPEPTGAGSGSRLVEVARSLLATPYEFAGEDPGGFDCSGFTSYVFTRAGRWLPRTVREQAAAGAWVPLDELAPGDLVFFGHQRSALEHVGIIVSDPGEPLTMIHAAKSRGVMESAVLASTYWLGRLQLGRRVLGEAAQISSWPPRP